MQHAQIGYRDPEKSCRAYNEIFETCESAGVHVDRYGLCLDWSMGYPREQRADGQRGTGLILTEPEDFARLAASAPVAPHFGDFVLGFPGAVETTQGALAAGATAIGNLGQYFTFRLPGWDDEVATTEATVTALGLIAGQDAEILIHSNLDDGFAALFTDLACCLGAALIERYIVEELIGVPLAHCFGHHFTDPVTRLAFQRALALSTDVPGTMIYGATVSYQGSTAANYASLASYLSIDILGQQTLPSGHAINPVPVTENDRIPEIDEIIDAQLFAGRLVEHAAEHQTLIDLSPVDRLAERLVQGGAAFRDAVLTGLREAGFDIQDPYELLLATKRIGARRLEQLFGPGVADEQAVHGRQPMVPATTYVALQRAADRKLAIIEQDSRQAIAQGRLKALVATTDVHEHGKVLVELVLSGLGVTTLDGGVSSDPDKLAQLVLEQGPDVLAISTYNGVALSFLQGLKQELAALDLELPILIGGRLNQIPEASNTSLPVDVSAELTTAGATVCREVEDALPVLLALAEARLNFSPHEPQP